VTDCEGVVEFCWLCGEGRLVRIMSESENYTIKLTRVSKVKVQLKIVQLFSSGQVQVWAEAKH
jgi:hypothetical protein